LADCFITLPSGQCAQQVVPLDEDLLDSLRTMADGTSLEHLFRGESQGKICWQYWSYLTGCTNGLLELRQMKNRVHKWSEVANQVCMLLIQCITECGMDRRSEMPTSDGSAEPEKSVHTAEVSGKQCPQRQRSAQSGANQLVSSCDVWCDIDDSEAVDPSKICQQTSAQHQLQNCRMRAMPTGEVDTHKELRTEITQWLNVAMCCTRIQQKLAIGSTWMGRRARSIAGMFRDIGSAVQSDRHIVGGRLYCGRVGRQQV